MREVARMEVEGGTYMYKRVKRYNKYYSRFHQAGLEGGRASMN